MHFFYTSLIRIFYFVPSRLSKFPVFFLLFFSSIYFLLILYVYFLPFPSCFLFLFFIFFSIPAYFIFIYHPHIFFSSQLIRDIYPLEGPSHSRLEVLELSMSIQIFDLGNENQVRTWFLELFIHLFVDSLIFPLTVFICIV